MIEFLWFHTYWFPAFVFMGGLITVLWLLDKVVSLIERVISVAARHSDTSSAKRHSNFN